MRPPGPWFPVGGDLTSPAPIPDALAAVLNTDDDAEEERALLREVRELRKRVEALEDRCRVCGCADHFCAADCDCCSEHG